MEILWSFIFIYKTIQDIQGGIKQDLKWTSWNRNLDQVDTFCCIREYLQNFSSAAAELLTRVLKPRLSLKEFPNTRPLAHFLVDTLLESLQGKFLAFTATLSCLASRYFCPSFFSSCFYSIFWLLPLYFHTVNRIKTPRWSSSRHKSYIRIILLSLWLDFLNQEHISSLFDMSTAWKIAGEGEILSDSGIVFPKWLNRCGNIGIKQRRQEMLCFIHI